MSQIIEKILFQKRPKIKNFGMFSHPSKIQLRVDKKVKINLKLIYIKPIKALYKPARNNKIWFITLILRYILPVYNRFTNIASNSLPNFWIVCLPRRTKNQQGCSRNYLRTMVCPRFTSGYAIVLSLFLKTLLYL